MFDPSKLFCQRCADDPLTTIISCVGRKRLGCSKNCPINCQRAANAYQSVFKHDLRNNIIGAAENDPNGELMLLYALNNNQAIFNGDVLVYPMKDSRALRSEIASDYLELLRDNIRVWKLPIVQTIDSKYCVPLAILSRTGKTTVVIPKIILLMIGTPFMDPFEVCGIFESVVYKQRVKCLLK